MAVSKTAKKNRGASRGAPTAPTAPTFMPVAGPTPNAPAAFFQSSVSPAVFGETRAPVATISAPPPPATPAELAAQMAALRDEELRGEQVGVITGFDSLRTLPPSPAEDDAPDSDEDDEDFDDEDDEDFDDEDAITIVDSDPAGASLPTSQPTSQPTSAYAAYSADDLADPFASQMDYAYSGSMGMRGLSGSPYAALPPRSVGGDNRPPTAQPLAPKISPWIDIATVKNGDGSPKYPQLVGKGYMIRVHLDLSLEFLQAAQDLQDRAREARKASLARGKHVAPQIHVNAIIALFRNLLADWTYPDQFGRPLPPPPVGLAGLRGETLIAATLDAAMEALSPNTKKSRSSKRR